MLWRIVLRIETDRDELHGQAVQVHFAEPALHFLHRGVHWVAGRAQPV